MSAAMLPSARRVSSSARRRPKRLNCWRRSLHRGGGSGEAVFPVFEVREPRLLLQGREGHQTATLMLAAQKQAGDGLGQLQALLAVGAASSASVPCSNFA